MQENESLNPTGVTGIGDPFVLHASDGKYYMYATSFFPADGKEGFNVWESGDLKSWSAPRQCYAVNERSFGYKDFWAPEVTEKDGRFYMFYSARSKENESLRIGLAVSESPVGPFIDVFDRRPLFDFGYAAIDGHLFTDDDGKRYFFYSRDCSENVYEGKHESHIYVADISDDFLTVSVPRFLMRADHEYELRYPGDYSWNEGPFVVKKDGWYYLFYSANFFASKYYCTCYAVSRRPDSGYVKADSPLIGYVEGLVSGPGHNSVTDDGQGGLWCVYHVHTDYNCPNHDRQMFLDKLYLENGTARVDGPTLRGGLK